ncbi:MAG: serpin family protein, partial [Phycisphaerae bacterium]
MKAIKPVLSKACTACPAKPHRFGRSGEHCRSVETCLTTVKRRGFILAAAIAIAAGCFGEEKQSTREKIEAKTIVEGNNKFAMALFAKLREGESNLFFSPYSISTALAMTYGGARGQTEAQMAEVLHFPIIVSPGKELSSTIVPDRPRFASAFGKIVKDLNARGKKGGYELTVANALWGQKDYGFLEEYLELVKANYGGQLNEVDFV